MNRSRKETVTLQCVGTEKRMMPLPGGDAMHAMPAAGQAWNHKASLHPAQPPHTAHLAVAADHVAVEAEVVGEALRARTHVQRVLACR